MDDDPSKVMTLEELDGLKAERLSSMKVEVNPAVHIDLLEIMERYIDESGNRTGRPVLCRIQTVRSPDRGMTGIFSNA
jgi:hypothetical protein